MPKHKHKPRGVKGHAHSRRRSGMSAGTVVGTILIVIAVPLLVVGLVTLLSPMTFFWMMSRMPESIQFMLFGDMFWGATPRSWAYLIGGALLGYIGYWLRSRARLR